MTTTDAQLDAAVAEVCRRDPVMAAHIGRVGRCDIRPGQGDYFQALARSIVYQQLAGKAAAAIHARFLDAVGGEMTPAAVLATPLDVLRGAGLSGAKAASLLNLATRASDGTVPLDGIEAFGDEEIITRLTMVRGIGRWTAEMFLLFELRRLDVWPTLDLGVQQGLKLIYGLDERPNAKQMSPLGDPFKPYRTIPAWYAWQAVHIARGEMVLPDSPAA
ncbi:MAG: DNA-3-methyladenine glycosylase 2 family protein [Candidatus Dormibacteraeota bacterium]|nr:DNA-3-methyladenine glycosylase 2 family protein [Candidatus Dormibacteraeota bacterium]